MRIINKVFMLIFLVANIFILLFDFFKYDIYNKADARSFGAGIAFGFIIYAVYGMYCILAIGTLLYTLLYIVFGIKKYKWKAFILSGIMITTILLLTVVPYTKGYLNVFYAINKDHFQKTIQMYNKGELQRYQCGATEYYVPYRLSSYIGKMDVQDNESSIKIRFYAYRGFFSDIVIVYSSDDSGINENDFSVLGYKINYSNVRGIDKNWYSAVIPKTQR